MGEEKIPGSLGVAIDRALLGEFYKRKNRGRSGELTGIGSKVVVIDCLGYDALATQVTITCGATPSRPVAAGVFNPAISLEQTSIVPPLRGRLEWGNDGTETEAEIDYVNGTVITLSAASVRLTVELEASVDVQDDSFIPPTVRAHIGYLPRANMPAQRTRVLQLAQEGSTGFLGIPPFAKRVRITSDDPAGALSGFFIDLAPQSTCQAFDASGLIDLPIPNGARTIFIENDGEGPVNVCAIFELWL